MVRTRMHIVTVSTIVYHAKDAMWCSHFEIEDVKVTGSVTTDSRSNRDTELVKIAADNVTPSITDSFDHHACWSPGAVRGSGKELCAC